MLKILRGLKKKRNHESEMKTIKATVFQQLKNFSRTGDANIQVRWIAADADFDVLGKDLAKE